MSLYKTLFFSRKLRSSYGIPILLSMNTRKAGGSPENKPSFPSLVRPNRPKLTKNGESFILTSMNKRLLTGAGAVIIALFLGASPVQEDKSPPPPVTFETPITSQEYPAQKPKSDYMSSILGRNTKPLGLKEDQALRRLLRQPAIKWAVRSGQRHVLD
jgi:hypothetical protein